MNLTINQKYVLIILFLTCCILNLYIISNGNVNDPNTKSYAINRRQEYLKPSLSPEWVKMWGYEDCNERFQEMDSYNETGEVYLIGTHSNSSAVVTDIMVLVKYNQSGEQEWNKTIYDEGSNLKSWGRDIVVDQSTGDLYIVGSTDTLTNDVDIFIAKYYDNGTQHWNITWGYSLEDSGRGIALDNKGNLYILGLTNYGSYSLMRLIKLEIFSQTQLWNATWGLTSEIYNFNDVTCSEYGEIYITGCKGYPGINRELLLIKYNENKVNEWNATWFKVGFEIQGNSVAIDSNNDVYVTGYRFGSTPSSTDEDDKMYLRKYSNTSTLIWSKIYEDLTNGRGNDIYIDPDNNIVVALEYEDLDLSDQFLCIGFNSSGYVKFEANWSWSGGYDIFAESITGYGTDHFYMAGDYDKDEMILDSDFLIVKNATVTYISNDLGPGGNDGTDGGDGSSDNNDDDDDSNEGIMGYNFFIILGITGFVSVLIIIKFKLENR